MIRASSFLLCICVSSCVVSGTEKSSALHQFWNDLTPESENHFGGSAAGELDALGPLSTTRRDDGTQQALSGTIRLAQATDVSRAMQNSFIRPQHAPINDTDSSSAVKAEATSPAPDIRTWEPHEDSVALIQEAEALSMPGGEVDNPCIERAEPDGCSRFAMSTFFDALDRANAGTGTARITVFGNSLHASDRILNIVRDRMQTRFGNAGQGFILPDRLANYGSRRRTGYQARGFAPYNVVWGAKTAYPMGAAGSLHLGRNRAKASFHVDGESTLRLYALAHPRGGTIQVSTETTAESFSLRASKQEGRVFEFSLPSDSKTVHVESRGQKNPVYGASFEGAGSGIMLDTLAIIGADSTRYLRSDETLFRAHMQSLQPDLVTLFLGGNEVKRIAWGSASAQAVQRDLEKLLDRVRDARPEVSCLVIGPLENVVGSQPTRKKRARRIKDPWSGRPETIWVNDIMRDVAHDKGCAYFDLYAAMGAQGAMQRLHRANLLHEDMIHPKGKGLDIIGELVFGAIMEAYVSSPVAATEGSSIARTAFR